MAGAGRDEMRAWGTDRDACTLRKRLRRGFCVSCVCLGIPGIDHVPLGNEEWNPWEADERSEQVAAQQRYENILKLVQNARSQLEQTMLRVQIWGKAAIGEQIQ